MNKKKYKVLQQVLDPSGSGGVSAEYRALAASSLKETYEFVPMVLECPHRGINLRDILFYYKIIKREKPDIVHIRGAAPDGLNAILAAKLVGKTKIFVSVHGMYSDLVYISRAKRWLSYHIVERLTFALADAISCVCKKANDRSRFDRYRKKMVQFVYNRIPDYSNFNQKEIRDAVRKALALPSDIVVGIYVGRVTKEKGVDYLAEALARCDANFRMLIVGDGDYFDKLKAMNLKNAILLGNQTDVYRYLFAADFFVSPSLHENHSIALLEAVAAGLPVIATDVGGNGEIIVDGENGKLIPPHDSEALLHSISQMICDGAYREGLALHGKGGIYDCFNNDKVDAQLDMAYKTLLVTAE